MNYLIGPSGLPFSKGAHFSDKAITLQISTQGSYNINLQKGANLISVQHQSTYMQNLVQFFFEM